MAAEYVLKEGNESVMLCERGIRTFETAYRFTLDLTAIPVLKEMTHLPVVVDPSHAAGRRALVEPLSLAAAAVGADGIIVEIHPEPDEAICDGPQQLRVDGFKEYAAQGRAGRRPGRQAAVRRGRDTDRRRVTEGRHRGRSPAAARAARARPDRRVGRPGGARAAGRARHRLRPGPASAGAGAGARRRRRRGRRSRRPRRRRRRAGRRAGAGAGAADCPGLRARRRRRGDRRRLDQARAGRVDRGRPSYIGGHPLAGAEVAGVEHARADLFAGATWYLTPRADSEGILLERLHRFVTGIGAVPTVIGHADHDRLMAAFSHVPHVVANALVAQATRALGDEAIPVVGPSFRDATRVAGANPPLWAGIYGANRDAVLDGLDATIELLAEARALLRRRRRSRRWSPGRRPPARSAARCWTSA